MFDVALKTVGNWERTGVPPGREHLVRQMLLTGSPLRGISNGDLVNELLRRLPPEWFDSWGPEGPNGPS